MEEKKLSLIDKVKEKFESFTKEAEKGHPCIGPAHYEIINENNFGVYFSDENFIMPKYVTAVEIDSYLNKIKLTAEITKEFHYFGKPSKYSNVYTFEEIEKAIQHFNETVKCMEIAEYVEVYNDETEEMELIPKVVTRYNEPRIRMYKTKFDVFGEGKKSWEFTITYTGRMNINVENEDTPVEVENNPEDNQK